MLKEFCYQCWLNWETTIGNTKENEGYVHQGTLLKEKLEKGELRINDHL